MHYFIKPNILFVYNRTLFNVFSWMTIYSVLLFSFSSIQQEKVFPEFKNNKDVFITYSFQNSVEQNINERNLRQKNSENIHFSIDPSLTLVTSQIRHSVSYQIVRFVRSFGSILVSSPNNHSLRSPPIIYI